MENPAGPSGNCRKPENIQAIFLQCGVDIPASIKSLTKGAWYYIAGNTDPEKTAVNSKKLNDVIVLLEDFLPGIQQAQTLGYVHVHLCVGLTKISRNAIPVPFGDRQRSCYESLSTPYE